MSWRVCIYGEVLTRQGLGPAVAVGASETVRCRWLYATTCPGLQFVNLLQSLQPNYTTITVPCNWKRAGPRCEHSRMPVRSDADVLFLSTSSTTNPVHFCASTLGCRSMLHVTDGRALGRVKPGGHREAWSSELPVAHHRRARSQTLAPACAMERQSQVSATSL